MKQHISDRLREAIRETAKSKRLTLVEVCQDAGIHYDTLRKFLNGTSDMTISRVEAVADALGYSVVGLLTRKAK